MPARWRRHGQWHEEAFVCRSAPLGQSVYMTYDLESQYRTLATLQAAPVPVAPLVGFEPSSEVLGSAFYVMRAVAGQAPPDIPPFTIGGWVLEATAEQQRMLYESSIDMLARIHCVDHAPLDLAHLPHGLDAVLAETEAWLRWAAEGRHYRVLEVTLAWLREHPPDATSDPTLNWGDARPGNLLYRDFEAVCVLDWEMASVGPPEMDLGWWLFVNRHHTDGIGFPRLPGFPDDSTTIAHWEHATGRRANDVFFFDVFAGLRFGIIVLRDLLRSVEDVTLLPDWNNDHNNTVTRLLTSMLDLSY
jgi:aminoglycoside phosphotransferase (APT) family kinase protein